MPQLVVDYFAYTTRSRSLCLAARLLVIWLHRLYCAYAVHPDAPSHRSTSRRSVAPVLTVRTVTASRGVTTRHPVAPVKGS
jgi:hypothetical protein